MVKAEFSPCYKEIDKPREECAVVGAISFRGHDVSSDVVLSLASLQHRGEDGTGIAVINSSNNVNLYKKRGLVLDVFTHESVLEENNLISNVVIGHNRYATAGGRGQECCLQPHVIQWEGRSFAIAHNGNIPTKILERIKKDLPSNISFKSDTDTEVLGWKIMFSRGESWPEKVENALKDVEGAYALTIATDRGELIGARDHHSTRPLLVGYTEDGMILASETRGFEYHMDKVTHWEEIKNGEIILAARGDIKKIQFASSKRIARCILEPVYFGFPTSRENGYDNSEIRRRMGLRLAKEYPILDKEGIIFGIPDSGNHVAEGFAEGSGVTYRTGLIHKDRYASGRRTFIAESQQRRQEMLEYKFSISQGVKGKNLYPTDDTFIKGNTSRRLVRGFRNAGATGVNFYLGCPPFVDICDMGIDFSNKDELVALRKDGDRYIERSEDEIAREIGADSVHYLSLDGLVWAIGRPKEELCTHCLTHEHPIFDSSMTC
jgi:amidophosphoribosyltransferase